MARNHDVAAGTEGRGVTLPPPPSTASLMPTQCRRRPVCVALPQGFGSNGAGKAWTATALLLLRAFCIFQL